MKYKIVILTVLFINLLFTGYLSVREYYRSEIVYINTSQVFDEFDLKKELSKKFESLVLSQGKVLDSIEVRYTSLVNNSNQSIRTEELNRLKREYLEAKRRFDEQKDKTSQEYDKQIWTQLNQYIKNFGEKKSKYRMILGTSGEGNLMYAEEYTDITNEIIHYVNDEYNQNNL